MGKSKNMLSAGLVLAVMVIYAVGFGGCGRTPVSPVSGVDTDYVAYFADLNSDNWVFGYHILSRQLDSFPVPVLPEPSENINRLLMQKIVVSADGTKLYIALSDSALVVNIEEPWQIAVLPISADGGVSVSPDNRYVGVLGDDGVHILSTTDYSMVFHDTDHVVRGQFSQEGGTFYASKWGGYAYRVNLDSDNTVERRHCTDWSLGQVVPAQSSNDWYLLTNNERCTGAIEVYDSDGGATLGRYTNGGYGEIELTPDGKRLTYTHPAHSHTVCGGGPSSFSVFDTETNTVQRVNVALDSADIDIYHDLPWWPMLDLEVTPDGGWYVVTGFDVIAIVDAVTFEVRNYEILRGKDIHYLTIQNSP